MAVAGIVFFFKSWFQFCNIVLLGNRGVSFLVGFLTGGWQKKKIKEYREHFQCLVLMVIYSCT